MPLEAEASKGRQTVAGDYILGRRLGSGGFGSVYEARHKDTQLPYAVKRIALSEEDAERFRKEALYPAKIASQSMHVLTVHSFFQDQEHGYFYLVTDLISQGDLRDFLDQNPKPLPLKLALETAIGIARGLVAIHEQNIVHRDVKPRNILMDWKDGRWIPKIADFGLARSTESVSMGEVASAGYAAPEQLDLTGERGPGPDSDLFSFGMILYELLTGMRPNNATNIREYGRWLYERNPPLPPSVVRLYLAPWPDLDFLCAELLEFDRDLRKTSAGEVVWTLSRILRDVERGGDTESISIAEETPVVIRPENMPTTANRLGNSLPPIPFQGLPGPRPEIQTRKLGTEGVHPENSTRQKKFLPIALASGSIAAMLLLIYVFMQPKNTLPDPASTRSSLANVAPPSAPSETPLLNDAPSNPPAPPAPVYNEETAKPGKVGKNGESRNGIGISRDAPKGPPTSPTSIPTGKVRFVALVAIEIFDEHNSKLGETPTELEISEGKHLFTFKYPPSYQRQGTFEVVKGKTLTVDANLEMTVKIISRPKVSTVMLTRGRPGVGPQDLGETDIPSIKLPIGAELEITTSQGIEKRVVSGAEDNNTIRITSP